MRAAFLPLFILASAVLGAACDEPRESATPSVAAAAAPRVRTPFERYGHPGPWWRNNAMQDDFDTDLSACRTASKQARQVAASGERQDSAYRAFVECMSERDWTRGYPGSNGSAGIPVGG